jgi:hypothetical protein
MPAPSNMSLADAVTEVLARIGQLDDGVANPLLVAEAKVHLNSAQRMLQVEYDLLAKRRRALVSVAAGRRFVDLPADAVHGYVNSAVWVEGSDSWPLPCGIDPAMANWDPARPAAYDLLPSTGIVRVAMIGGGSGYTDGTAPAIVTGGSRLDSGHDPIVNLTVTAGAVTAVEIIDSGSEWVSAPTLAPVGAGTGFTYSLALGGVQLLALSPIPSTSGTLEVGYRAGVIRLEDDEDLLALDDEAVIGKASVLLAAVKNLPIAKSLADFHLVYMDKLKRTPPGRSASLSGWRRDDPMILRQPLPRLDPRRA